jgi:hypothetical protein
MTAATEMTAEHERRLALQREFPLYLSTVHASRDASCALTRASSLRRQGSRGVSVGTKG